MNKQTESAIKTVLSNDEEISAEAIQRAIAVLNANPIDRRDFVRVITVDEAAKTLGVSRSAVYGYMNRGRLTKVVTPYGATLGIRSDSLDAFRRCSLKPLKNV